MKRLALLTIALVPLGFLGWAVAARLATLAAEADAGPRTRPPAPVAVAPVERGTITRRRVFSGALEPEARLVLAPKISGRVDRVHVDLGDPVERGALVVELDDDELVQAVHQAEADLTVARANLGARRSAAEIATRALDRARRLRADGVASESQLDAALADELAARAQVELAEAGVPRAEAALEAAQVRLGYCRVHAEWSEGDEQRVVSQRFVDEGETVSANAPLVSIVELDPVLAVVHAPERDYGSIALGQRALLTTDAHPGRSFEAHVAHIAPVFRRETRQARIELSAPNPGELLKPGMFVRATLELERIDDAVIVPFDALTTRDGEPGVFVLDTSGERVHWRPALPGAREGARLQVSGAGIEGQVVVLGQELCEDGGAVTVPDGDGAAGGTGAAAPAPATEPPTPSAR